MSKTHSSFVKSSSPSILACLESSELSFWETISPVSVDPSKEKDVSGWKVESYTQGKEYRIVARRHDIDQVPSYYVTVFDELLAVRRTSTQQSLLDIPGYVYDVYTAKSLADALQRHQAALEHFDEPYR